MRVFILFFLMILAAGCVDDKAGDPVERAEEVNEMKGIKESSMEDLTRCSAKLSMAKQASEFILTLAPSQSGPKNVHEFAAIYSKAYLDLKSLCDRKNISLPTEVSEDDQESLAALHNHKDPVPQYLKMVANINKDLIDVLTKINSSNPDAELRSFAVTLKEQLEGMKISSVQQKSI